MLGYNMDKIVTIICLILIGCLMVFICVCASNSVKTSDQSKEMVAVVKTTMGTMTFKFFPKDAPLSCANFIKLAKAGFYNNREFYRVVKGHVIQAGVGEGEGVDYTIKAEFNKNPHITGAVGMARAEDPDSASTEFYICLVPRPKLDGKYTVFGQLIDGFDVLDKIGNIEVDEKVIEGVAFHHPKTPVRILSISIEEK